MDVDLISETSGPTNAENPDESGDVYERFIATLIDLVKLARLERFARFELMTQEREQNIAMNDLDWQRTELSWVQNGLRSAGNYAPEEVYKENIDDLEAKIDLSNAKIRDLGAEGDKGRAQIQQKLEKAFSLERRLDKAQLTTRIPFLPPLFWRRLGQVKVSSRLLSDDLKSLSTATTMEELSKQATRQAATRVKADMETLASSDFSDAGRLKELAGGLSDLHRAIHLCCWHVADLCKWQEIVAARRRHQYTQESSLLISDAALYLEAEKLVPRDRIRMSLVAEYQPGEPMLFLNQGVQLLTPGQRRDIADDGKAALDWRRKCEKLLYRLDKEHGDDLAEFLRDHPHCSVYAFYHDHLLYRRQATARLVQAEDDMNLIDFEAMKAGVIREYYDFDWDERDEKHYAPRTAAQLEARAREFPFERRKAALWLINLPGDIHYQHKRNHDIAACEQEPPLDKWHCRPVDVQDEDRYSDLTPYSQDEGRVRKKLLMSYKAYCKDLRDETLAQD